jgi:AcrR family transcriptional regulator
MDRKQDIVRAAETLFAEHGFDATRVARIAQVAGLSPGAGGLYRHFRSKRALLSAVIDLALERLTRTLELKPDFDALDLSFEERLIRIGKGLLSRGRESRDLLIIMDHDLPRFPELHARVQRDLAAPALGALERWLADQVAEPIRARLDTAALAQVAWDSICRRVTSYEAVPAISDTRFIGAWALALRGGLETASREEGAG